MAEFEDILSGAGSGAVAGTAISPGLGTAIGGVVGGIGGLLAGQSTRKAANAEAARIAAESAAKEQAALQPLQGYDPNKYYREENSLGDIYAPDMASSRNLQSEMGGIRLDPNLAAAQSASLAGLSDVIGQGGMTLQDRANFQDANSAAQLQASRQQAAMRDEMAARGMAGSGNETVARMMAAQGAADASAKAGRNMNAMAQQRALDALMQRGSLAGNMSSQDFSQKSAQAQAADNIAQFNERNRLNQSNLGSQYKFDASRTNQQVRQGVEQRNVTGLSNLGSQTFDKANAMSGVYQNRSVNPSAKLPTAMESFNSAVGTIGTAAKGYNDYTTAQAAAEEAKKKNQNL
jgi:hypothetical protein